MVLIKKVKNKLKNLKKIVGSFLKCKKKEEDIVNISNGKKELELKENNTKLEEGTLIIYDEYSNNCNNYQQEIENLRAELKLKQNILKVMRESLMRAEQKKEALEVAVKRVDFFNARNEDLQEQLRRKCVSEIALKP